MALFDDPGVPFDSETVTFDEPSILLWKMGSRLVRDAFGRLLICDECPCDTGTGTGTGTGTEGGLSDDLDCCDDPITFPETLFLEVTANTATSGYWSTVPVGTIYEMTLAGLCPDGSVRYCHNFGSPVCTDTIGSQDGLALYFICAVPGSILARIIGYDESGGFTCLNNGFNSNMIVPVGLAGAVFVGCDFTYPFSIPTTQADPGINTCMDGAGTVTFEVMD